MTFFSPSQRALGGWKVNAGKQSLLPSMEELSVGTNMGRYLCFSRHHGFVILAAFCPNTSDSKKCLLLPSFIFVCFC